MSFSRAPTSRISPVPSLRGSATSSPVSSTKKSSSMPGIKRVQPNPIPSAVPSKPSSTPAALVPAAAASPTDPDPAIPSPVSSDPSPPAAVVTPKSDGAEVKVEVVVPNADADTNANERAAITAAVESLQLEQSQVVPSAVNPVVLPSSDADDPVVSPIPLQPAMVDSTTTAVSPAKEAADQEVKVPTSIVRSSASPRHLSQFAMLLHDRLESLASTPFVLQPSRSTTTTRVAAVAPAGVVRRVFAHVHSHRSSIKSIPIKSTGTTARLPTVERRFREDVPSSAFTSKVLAALFPTPQELENAFPNGVPKNVGCYQDQEVLGVAIAKDAEDEDASESEEEEDEVLEEESEPVQGSWMQDRELRSLYPSNVDATSHSGDSKGHSTNTSNSSAGSPCFDVDPSSNRRRSMSSSSNLSPASFSPQQDSLMQPTVPTAASSTSRPAVAASMNRSNVPSSMIENEDTLHLFPAQYSTTHLFGDGTTHVKNESDMLVSSDSKMLFHGGFNAIAVQRCHAHARTSLLKQRPMAHLPKIMVRLLRPLGVGEPVVLMRHPINFTPQILQCQCGEWACQYHLACRCDNPHCIWPEMIHDGKLPHFHHVAPIEDSDCIYHKPQQ